MKKKFKDRRFELRKSERLPITSKMIDMDVSPTTLALRTNIPLCTLYRLLDGSRKPNIEHVYRILHIYGGIVSIDDFFFPDEIKDIKKEMLRKQEFMIVTSK